jgi:hypothetical protein
MPLTLLYPLLAQVLLTFIVMIGMASLRMRALTRGEVRVEEIALDSRGWPDRARQFGNNFRNQFETPVLFYVLILAAMHVGAVNWLMAVLAWAFVASRVVHAFIHLGANVVRQRGAAYLVGIIALVGMWCVIVVKLVTRGVV